MQKLNSVIQIKTTLEGNFFKLWLAFLGPFHNLTPRELDVATEFLKKRFELSKVINDEEVIEKVLMNSESKKEIKQKCDMSSAQFQVILGKLRKNKIIVNGALNPKFIPNNISTGDKTFQLLLSFDLDGDRKTTSL